MTTKTYEPLHPQSVNDLRQLLRLHGRTRVLAAIQDILQADSAPVVHDQSPMTGAIRRSEKWKGID